MNEGYLQTKIRENQTEIEILKKQLFEQNRIINLLKQNIDETQKKIDNSYDDVKEVLETIDTKKINTMITNVANHEIKKFANVAINDIKNVLDNTSGNNKLDLEEMKNNILKNLSDILIDQFSIFSRGIGDDLINIHKILRDNNIIKKSFDITAIGFVNPFSEMDLLVTINYKDGKLKCNRGKGIVKKFVKKLRNKKEVTFSRDDCKNTNIKDFKSEIDKVFLE